MILPTLAALIATRQNATELDRVRQFLRLAHTGREDHILPPYNDQGEPTLDESNVARWGWRTYRFQHGWIDVDVRSGQILHHHVTGNEPAPAFVRGADGNPVAMPRALTDAEAVALAERAYEVSGHPGGIAVNDVSDFMGNNGTSVELNYSPVYRGVPYDGPNGLINLDRQTGLLTDFGAPRNVFAPPLSLTPGGSIADARLVALQAVLAWRKEGVYREDPEHRFRLVLWQPHDTLIGQGEARFGHWRQRYEPSHIADLKAGRALLAYSGTLLGKDGRKWYVHLDARTGRSLELADDFPDSGAGGASPKSASRSIPVPRASRSWRVAMGQEGWKAWSAPVKAALVPVSAKAPAGKRIDLTDGQSAFAATYDAKANLLGISGKAYRPGPALASLLRKRTK